MLLTLIIWLWWCLLGFSRYSEKLLPTPRNNPFHSTNCTLWKEVGSPQLPFIYFSFFDTGDCTRGTIPLSLHPQPFFILSLAKLPRLASYLRSLSLSLQHHWAYRCGPPLPASTSLGVEYLYINYLEFFCMGDLYFHLFIKSFISVWTHGCLFYTVGYNKLPFNFVQIVPALAVGSHSFDFCVPLMAYH